ncbi:MAG: hypothetical protein ACRCWC_02375 [Plesiomonas shigelloides]
MTNPITPPPELVEEWIAEVWHEGTPVQVSASDLHLASKAAEWGADQELEACCEWLQDPDLNVDTYKLRNARRPKPPSLKEQALKALHVSVDVDEFPKQYDTIRRALEQLDD